MRELRFTSLSNLCKLHSQTIQVCTQTPESSESELYIFLATEYILLQKMYIHAQRHRPKKKKIASGKKSLS